MFTAFVLVSKAGLGSSLSPPDLLALRYAVAGTVLLPVFLRHGLLGLAPGQALALALSGGLGFAAFAYAGFALAPASHGSALIHGTLPLTTLLLSGIALRHASSRIRLYGATIIAAGIVCLVAEGVGGLQPAQLLGDALLLAASFCWSGYGILARRFRVRTVPAAALVAVVSAVLFVPAYLLLGSSAMFEANAREVLWQAVFQGFAIGVLSLVVYTKAIEILGASGTTLYAAAAPALTALFSIPILGEHPGLTTWIGVLAVTCGIVVSARSMGEAK